MWRAAGVLYVYAINAELKMLYVKIGSNYMY